MAQTHYFTKSLQAIGGWRVLETERSNWLVTTSVNGGHWTYQGLDNNKNLADWDYLGRNITCMFLQSIIFFSFNLMLHYQILPDFIQRRFQVRAVTILGHPNDIQVLFRCSNHRGIHFEDPKVYLNALVWFLRYQTTWNFRIFAEHLQMEFRAGWRRRRSRTASYRTKYGNGRFASPTAVD